MHLFTFQVSGDFYTLHMARRQRQDINCSSTLSLRSLSPCASASAVTALTSKRISEQPILKMYFFFHNERGTKLLWSLGNDLDTSCLPPHPLARCYLSICLRGQCHHAGDYEGVGAVRLLESVIKRNPISSETTEIINLKSVVRRL